MNVGFISYLTLRKKKAQKGGEMSADGKMPNIALKSRERGEMTTLSRILSYSRF